MAVVFAVTYEARLDFDYMDPIILFGDTSGLFLQYIEEPYVRVIDLRLDPLLHRMRRSNVVTLNVERIQHVSTDQSDSGPDIYRVNRDRVRALSTHYASLRDRGMRWYSNPRNGGSLVSTEEAVA